jgi:hypothetical protein
MKLLVLYVKFKIIFKLLNILKSPKKLHKEQKLMEVENYYLILEIFVIISLHSIFFKMFAGMKTKEKTQSSMMSFSFI